MSSTTQSRFEELDSTSSPEASTSSLPLPPSSQTKSPSTTLEKELEKKKVKKSTNTTSEEEENEEDVEEHEDSVWWTPSELREILDRSTSLKVTGNTYFGKGDYEIALTTYRDGLVELPMRTRVRLIQKESGKGKHKVGEGDLLDELTGRVGEMSVKPDNDDEEDEEEVKKEGIEEEQEGESAELTELRSILFANVAACLIKLNRWKEAVTACDDALEDNPTYVKALHRRAMASESIGSWSSLSSALEDYKTLAALPGLAPSLLSTIKQGERRLPGLITIQQQKEKDEVMGKLKDLGNTVLGKFGFSTDNFKFTEQPGGGYSMNFER